MYYIQRAKNFRAKKRFGQNFLINADIIEKIISQVNPDDTVLEIGAGLGFVTEKLVEKAKKVIAVEIDKYAIEELEKLKPRHPEGRSEAERREDLKNKLLLIQQDILKVDISALATEKLKIIGNIPYNITTPIIVHLLGEIADAENKNRNAIKEIILMVQYEVAKRIVADETSSGKEYGALSLLCNYHCECEIIQKVEDNCFYPKPKVHSALVRLIPRESPAVELTEPKMLRKIIRAIFSARRKTLKNALKIAGFEENKITEALAKTNIPEGIRGEKLSLAQMAKLADCFYTKLH